MMKVNAAKANPNGTSRVPKAIRSATNVASTKHTKAKIHSSMSTDIKHLQGHGSPGQIPVPMSVQASFQLTFQLAADLAWTAAPVRAIGTRGSMAGPTPAWMQAPRHLVH